MPEPLRGPTFGSYSPDDVGWLLTDLSHVALEAPAEEREAEIQSGRAHYSMSLPVEFQPSDEYQEVFHQALTSTAGRIATDVGRMTEHVLTTRGDDVVLVSLARAGTPIGILARAWAQAQRGLSLPHYAISIIRGRGIDHVALRYLADHYDPRNVVFVDGWTGKGAITRELTASIRSANAALGTAFVPDLAVLADVGHCVEIFGTRADYLIPSACLNSTVSGLVSRTVLNELYIDESSFHGAKFYAELASYDVSADFLDSVIAEFDRAAGRVSDTLSGHLATDRRPTWQGWAAVERIAQTYGIGDVNLVKPGVGETTRVLLRRVPWRVLVNPTAVAELTHVRLLAEERGVDVVEVAGLPFSCVGIIHPRYERSTS